jgi:hypothetical protein
MSKTPDLDKFIWENPSFPNKTSDDEDILLVVREDLVLILFRFLGLYSVFFLLLLLRSVVVGFSDYLTISIYDSVMYGVGAILTLIFLVIFHNYYLSLQIITTDRIIDIDQTSLFNREVNSSAIQNIQDVTYIKKGLLNLLFNFGNVVVETSGRPGGEIKDEGNGFVFNNIPSPAEIAHLLDTLIQKEQEDDFKKQAGIQAEALQKVLSSKILN